MHDALEVPVSPDDHVRGPAGAAVTLVEYADVECPYCGELETVLREVLAERTDVRLVFRHFPLVEMHPHAYSSALALEAAAAHGKFWELHDVLFDHADALGRSRLAEYAQGLGLDPDSVLRPAAERYDADVRADFQGGLDLGVEGTPGLFINGHPFHGEHSRASLLAAIDLVLRQEPPA